MSTYYVSNENGDWWTFDTESAEGQTLFIITEEELKEKAGDDDINNLDKLDRLIREHGTAQDVEVNQ